MTIVFVANAKFRKLLKFGTMGVLAGLLYLTDGRTATAATAVALMVMVFISMRPSPFKIMFGMSCLGAGLVGVLGFLLSGQADRMLGTAIGEDVFTLNGRVALWEFALQSWADSPLIGVGYYATRVILLPMFPFAGHTHNSLIEILLSTGLVGALLSLAFLAICAHAAVITKDRTHIGILILMVSDGSLNPLLFTPSTTHLLLLVTTMNAYTVYAHRRAARPARRAAQHHSPASRHGIGDAGTRFDVFRSVWPIQTKSATPKLRKPLEMQRTSSRVPCGGR